MTHTALALLGFAGWTIVLVLVLLGYRAPLMLFGGRAPNSFSATGADVSPFGQRIVRAHANCVENLPVAGAVLLFAIASGHTDVTEALALPFLGARVAQSCVHLTSTSNAAVSVRFTFFAVQLAIVAWWMVGLVRELS
ncbi:MAG: MAPEG family protein [Deltaproteobacteria bacterium]|nr:MAPEG family protein [Deltaproteobacteria bacterium]